MTSFMTSLALGKSTPVARKSSPTGLDKMHPWVMRDALWHFAGFWSHLHSVYWCEDPQIITWLFSPGSLVCVSSRQEESFQIHEISCCGASQERRQIRHRRQWHSENLLYVWLTSNSQKYEFRSNFHPLLQLPVIKDFLEVRKKAEDMGLFKPSTLFYVGILAHIIAFDLLGWWIFYRFGTSWVPFLLGSLCLATAQVRICGIKITRPSDLNSLLTVTDSSWLESTWLWTSLSLPLLTLESLGANFCHQCYQGT